MFVAWVSCRQLIRDPVPAPCVRISRAKFSAWCPHLTQIRLVGSRRELSLSEKVCILPPNWDVCIRTNSRLEQVSMDTIASLVRLASNPSFVPPSSFSSWSRADGIRESLEGAQLSHHCSTPFVYISHGILIAAVCGVPFLSPREHGVFVDNWGARSDG